MSNVIEDMYKRITGKDIDLSNVSLGDVATTAGGMYLNNKLGLSDGVLSGTKKPPVGYQGGIDRLTKVREQVNRPFAGSQGRKTGLLTPMQADVKTMDDMDFADADFSGMTPELIASKKDELLAEENARLQKAADDAGAMQGDIYAQNQQRRPGSAGRRYFTDTIYAKTPEADQKPMSLEAAQDKARRQKLSMEGKSEEEIEEIMNPTADTSDGGMAMGGRVRKYAQGGIAGAHKGYYLGGKTDGMADKVPARIDGNQEARLSDGEFVIPADVVSHLGNGNSDAGAQQLHNMMDGVRTARTGNPEQGKQINPQQFMPTMAQGGLAQFAGGGNVNAVQGVNSRFRNQPYTTNFSGEGDTANPTDPMAGSNEEDGGDMSGTEIGTESSLSDWAGDYVTDMLTYGRAEAETPYEAYTGPLTAGSSTLQDSAITGIQALNNPLSSGSITNQMGAFTPDAATIDPYMNPYTQNVIDRTAADMTRQDQINQLQQRQQLTSAGAFGGSRDALLRAESAGNLSRNIGDMAAEQRALNYGQAMDRAKAAQEMTNKYGIDVLAAQGAAGQVQRDIASEGVAADYAQFREERDYDAKRVQYMQSLLQGLPIAATSSVYSEPSEYQEYLQSIGGIEALIAAMGGTEAPAETTEPTQETT